MSDSDQAASAEEAPEYECHECGNVFRLDQDADDSTQFECPECRSDNPSPLNG